MKEALKSLGATEEVEPRAALSAVSRQKGEGVMAGEYAEKSRKPSRAFNRCSVVEV